jgi:hypothetical protein
MSPFKRSLEFARRLVILAVTSSWASGVGLAQTNSGSNPNLRNLTQISVDTSKNPGTDTTIQHKTEVDPGQTTFGNTIVTTFQDGEIADYNGAAQVGWATSLDGGSTWRHGYIPGTSSYYWVQVVVCAATAQR